VTPRNEDVWGRGEVSEPAPLGRLKSYPNIITLSSQERTHHKSIPLRRTLVEVVHKVLIREELEE
jgi:hypothetical protein